MTRSSIRDAAAGELSMLFKVVSEIVHPLTRQPLTPIETISHPLRCEIYLQACGKIPRVRM